MRLYLPRSAGAAAPVPPPLSSWVDEKGAGRVLVVDDNPSMLAMVVNTLQSMGYDTIASRSGKEALDVVRSDEKIDLLFTDLVLPGGIDGAELAHEARRVRPGLPLLLTTGFVAVGADATVVVDDSLPMLRKPYRQPELARMLRQVLR